MVTTVNNIPTPPVLKKAEKVETAPLIKSEAPSLDKQSAPAIDHNRSTQVEKFANNKVTITVKDSEGEILFEHPPKKALVYQAALDKSMKRDTIIRQHNLKA